MDVILLTTTTSVLQGRQLDYAVRPHITSNGVLH